VYMNITEVPRTNTGLRSDSSGKLISPSGPRKSIRCKDASLLVHRVGNHISSADDKHSSQDLSHYTSQSGLETSYDKVLQDAKKCIGHGATEGAFHEEWDVQLLVECGRTLDGSRVVIFCPKFLSPFLNDPEELDNAFRFVLLNMDEIVRDDAYIFIYFPGS